MKIYVGLDLGTTSVKACAFDEKGELLKVCSQPYPLDQPQHGAAEQDAQVVFSAAEKALAELLTAYDKGVCCIGISTAMHSVILLDDNRDYLGPVYTWADTRASADRFTDEERKDFHRRTGTPVHAMSPLVKLPWLAETQPEVWEKMVYVGDLKSCLLDRWCEDGFLLDTQLASATGLYHATQKTWYDKALEKVGITGEQLPEVVAPTTRLQWKAGIAKKLGVTDSIPLVIGGSDGCLANLGSELIEPGKVALSIGTSAAIRATHRQVEIDPDFGLFNYHLIDDRYVIGGASNNGGKVLEWLHALMGHDYEDIGAMIEAAAEVETEGLVFKPYVFGERAPLYDPAASATFSGLRSYHQPAHFARAALEGITDNLVVILTQLEAATRPIEDIIASGGFTESAFWVDLLARKSERQVTIADSAQASALGASLVARLATEDISLEALIRTV